MPAIITPLSGDRSAFDTANHAVLHAQDIFDASFTYHKNPNDPGGGEKWAIYDNNSSGVEVAAHTMYPSLPFPNAVTDPNGLVAWGSLDDFNYMFIAEAAWYEIEVIVKLSAYDTALENPGYFRMALISYGNIGLNSEMRTTVNVGETLEEWIFLHASLRDFFYPPNEDWWNEVYVEFYNETDHIANVFPVQFYIRKLVGGTDPRN
jgi:hypothetical protein